MGLFRSIGARKDSSRGTAAIEVRKGLAWLFSGPGVLPGADSPLVTGTSEWAYSIGKAGFVSTRGASDGVHLFGNDGQVTVGATGAGSTVPVAPGSGLQRIDIIWVLHPSASENSDTTSQPTFGVTSGEAKSIAQPPTIPAGALELARNLMTSSATSTASSGNSITQSAPRAFVGSTRSISYTPTLVNMTLGTGGSAVGSYVLANGYLTARVVLTLGTGFTVSSPYVSLPPILPASGYATGSKVGDGLVIGLAGAGARSALVCVRSGVTAQIFNHNGAALSPTSPVALAAGDRLELELRYPVA